MKRIISCITVVALSLGCLCGCGADGTDGYETDSGAMALGLDEVAELISSLPVGEEQMSEVYAAVSSSSENGFDEEYMMRDLFEVPGRGVGEEYLETKAAVSYYERPMRELIREGLLSRLATKASSGGPADPDAFMDGLTDSDIQIYWPYSENWDKESLPIVTYAPDDDSRETNIGYRMYYDDEGVMRTEKVLVDEQTAVESPVWVINRNDDSNFRPLEFIRKNDPGWGMPGGEITVDTKADSESSRTVRTLVLKDFTMKRNYDCWFAGASEFFVKIGSVENFCASTEAEMRVFSPTVTDFNIVVRRKYKDEAVPFNAVLVSEWTDQLEKCAFIITEDDGGTIDTWKCSAVVKYNSKAYGVEISIPIYSKDDIVWRGQLGRNYIEANENLVGHFGDVDLTFQITSTNY